MPSQTLLCALVGFADLSEALRVALGLMHLDEGDVGRTQLCFGEWALLTCCEALAEAECFDALFKCHAGT